MTIKLFYIDYEDPEHISNDKYTYLLNEQGGCKVFSRNMLFQSFEDAIELLEETFVGLCDGKLYNLRDVIPEDLVPPAFMDYQNGMVHENEEDYKVFIQTLMYYIKNFDILTVVLT